MHATIGDLGDEKVEKRENLTDGEDQDISVFTGLSRTPKHMVGPQNPDICG